MRRWQAETCIVDSRTCRSRGLFNPLSEGVWLASELDGGGDLLYGPADFGAVEISSFRLSEIAALELSFGLGIERDILFTGDFLLSVWAEAARGWRHPSGRDRPFVTIWVGNRVVWKGSEEDVPARFRDRDPDLFDPDTS